MPTNYELATKKFIDSCHFKDDIDCIFLAGSHASGNADEFSDIDLFIVLNDSVDWRERGNKRVDGFLIEYFANPARQIKKYIYNDHAKVKLTSINMILNGIVVFGDSSVANELIEYCRKKMASGFAKMNHFDINTELYFLWNDYDELSRAYAYQAPDFTMQFHLFINNAFELYSRYTCSPVPNYHNRHRWLADDQYFAKYGLPPHNDQNFLVIIKKSFDCDNTTAMYDLSKALYSYITEHMGGFDIDNFTLRGPCD